MADRHNERREIWSGYCLVAKLQNACFSRIEDDRVAQGLGADKSSALNQLQAQVQFSLRENENWLRFWLPGR